jgi:hypothetical protein
MDTLTHQFTRSRGGPREESTHVARAPLFEKSQLAISVQQFSIHFTSYAGATTAVQTVPNNAYLNMNLDLSVP